MDGKIEERIELYCHIYEQIYQRVQKMEFENSSEIALGIFMEVSRSLRRETAVRRRDRGKQISNRSDEELATRKQREAIHKFGVQKIPKDLSKKEASEILNELIGFSKEKDGDAISRLVQELNQKWNLSQ